MIKRLVTYLISLIVSLTQVFSTGCGGDPSQTPAPPEAYNPVPTSAVTEYSPEDADYSLRVDAADEIHDVSELLFGVFFEDINFAADGGLYAEMVANRSFEFTSLAAGDELFHWLPCGDADFEVVKGAADCLNENNPNYIKITNSSGEAAGVRNTGFMEGMSVTGGEIYDFSMYARSAEGYAGKVKVMLLAGDEEIASGEIGGVTDGWTKYTLSLTPSASASGNASLAVAIDDGSIEADMISLFPRDTFRGRENGLRRDLCELLEDMKPKFIRFPGGCVTEGEDDRTQYSWKDSIAVGSDGLPLLFDGGYGSVAARPQGENIWTDHAATEDPYPCFMTYGLGFYEYFRLAEDIGAVGVPVLDAGLYCQMRGKGDVDMDSEKFAAYVQDMLDLVEFCRGDESTVWGKVRVSLGHPEPFKLRYICVGNENEGEDFYLRYSAFAKAFNEAKRLDPELYAGINLIYSSGAADATGSENYIKSYEYAASVLPEYDSLEDFAGATDQHYYKDPEWFLKHTDYYDEDNYPRTPDRMTETIYGGAIKVFLGEYAARSNTLKAALAEAAYMTGLERNGDVVEMAAYAPLFSSSTARHWAPDLIWFNNSDVQPSVNYYAQKLFSVNQSEKILASSLDGAAIPQKALSGRVGLGTWYTQAEFDNLRITDDATGRNVYSTDFTLHSFRLNWDNVNDGNFKVRGGKLLHADANMNYSDTGDIAYLRRDVNSTDYTFTVDATKTDGSEGFLVAFAVEDAQNNWFWNIGGWDNTVSCLQHVEGGEKTGRVPGTVKDFAVETGRTYKLTVKVSGTRVKCMIDGETYVDYDTANNAEANAYHVVGTDRTGDVIIKLVNVSYCARTFAINVENAEFTGADAQVMAGVSLADENVIGQPGKVTPENVALTLTGSDFNYTVPGYSVTVLRLHR